MGNICEYNLNKIFVSFNEIYLRYMRFNKIFVEELKVLIQDPVLQEIINRVLKPREVKNGVGLFKKIENKRDLFLLGTDSKEAMNLIFKFSEELKIFFENPTVKRIADNASDYMFGVQHLLVSLHVQIEQFIEVVLKTKGINKTTVTEDKRLKQNIEIYNTLRIIRNSIAHNDGLLDDIFRIKIGLENKKNDDIEFCLEGILNFEKYFKSIIITILFVLKNFCEESDVITFYDKFEMSKHLKLTEDDIN